MRRFIFTAKNIGRERYLTYVMGEGMEVDEDVLDYCEDNDIPEILNIIYEEDDDYDYLTYDVTGRTSLETFTQDVMTREKVFTILRNISLSMISVKEHAIPLSYILLNKGFMYIDPDTLDVKFLYLPVEGDASVSTEFKSFVRQLMAGMKYDVEEDLSYVGQLLTYVNGDSFNLRGLIGLTEAMMQDAGMAYSEEAGIATEDGAEVVDSASPDIEEEKDKGAMDFMKDLDSADDKMPEIGDDDEDDIELEEAEKAADYATEVLTEEMEEEASEEAEAEPEAESVEETVEETAEEEPAEEAEAEEVEETAEEEVEPVAATRSVEREVEHTETLEDIKARLQELAGAVDGKNPPPKQQKKTPSGKPVRVSRAAMLKAAEEAIEEEDAAAAEAEEIAEAEEKTEKDKKKNNKKEAEKKEAEKKEAEKKEPEKKAEVIDNTILGATGAIKINPYLIRVNTKERIMINKPVFKIGKATRGVDYRVSGNGAISRQHAVIVHKGDSYYIKDNKSTNHTYVNDVEIADDEEVLLKDNASIRLGDEDFTFRLG